MAVGYFPGSVMISIGKQFFQHPRHMQQSDQGRDPRMRCSLSQSGLNFLEECRLRGVVLLRIPRDPEQAQAFFAYVPHHALRRQLLVNAMHLGTAFQD